MDLKLGFAGLNTNDAGGIIEPPDTIAAAGPTAVVEIVNSNIAYYNKATGKLPLQRGARRLLRLGQPLPIAPLRRLRHLRRAGRAGSSSPPWTSTSAPASYFNFAVSNDSNPLDGFSEIHQVETTEVSPRTGETLFTDYPRLGWNADAYVVSFNMFGFQTQTQYNAKVLTIQKSTVLDQNASTLTDYQVDRPLPNSTMVPATMHGSAAGGPMWFVEEKGLEQDGTYSNLRVVKMTNVLSASPTFTDSYIPVDPYTITPFPGDTQGVVSTALDTRILSLDWRNNQMVATQNAGIDGDTNVHARWYVIATGGSAPSIAQQGTVAPGPDVGTYMPSAALGTDGSIGMTYIGVVADRGYVGLRHRSSGDRPRRDHAGGGLGQGRRAELSGDAGGRLQRDHRRPPNGTSYWAANEYAIATSDISLPNWGTWIANFQLSPPPAGGTANFLRVDTATQGTWKGAYGGDGQTSSATPPPTPAYATVTPAGQTAYTWAATTADPRALQKAAAADRGRRHLVRRLQFTVDVNLTDGQAHRVAAYFLDWDNTGRSERSTWSTPPPAPCWTPGRSPRSRAGST